MADIKDYRKVDLPEDKEYSEYSYHERRAYIYGKALENGGVRVLPETYREMASKFDVHTSTIGDDVDAVREAILQFEFTKENIREDVASTLMWISKQAREDGDMDTARKATKVYKDWAMELGIEEKEPEKVEVSHEGAFADKLADIYEDESEEE